MQFFPSQNEFILSLKTVNCIKVFLEKTSRVIFSLTNPEKRLNKYEIKMTLFRTKYSKSFEAIVEMIYIMPLADIHYALSGHASILCL